MKTESRPPAANLSAAHSSSARRSTESSAATSRPVAPARARPVGGRWQRQSRGVGQPARVSPAAKATTPSAMPTGTSLTASPVSRISRRATVTCSAASARRPSSRAARRAAPGTWRCRCGRRPSGTAAGRRRRWRAQRRSLRSSLRAGRGTGGADRRRRRTARRGPARPPAYESVECVPPRWVAADAARQRVDRLVTAVDGRPWQGGEELVERGERVVRRHVPAGRMAVEAERLRDHRLLSFESVGGRRGVTEAGRVARSRCSMASSITPRLQSVTPWTM